MKLNEKSTLNNEKGQMAIFAALMFQVLFVFFAMAINVSLIVHDKINLQNSADLAAYYGAAKQAEILNLPDKRNRVEAWSKEKWTFLQMGLG